MITDLTAGSPSRILWRFSVPMLVSVMFQQLYSIADSIIAGRFAGEDALAAVGASYPVTMIFMAIAIGSNIGCSVIISQLFGAKQHASMKTAVYTTFIASAGVSLVLTVSGLIFCSSVMQTLQTPANILADGVLYLRIYIFGLLFLFLYNISTGVFNALGDSRTPLYLLIGSSIGNIALDLLFVAVFHMGVAGVGWATFAAQGISAVLAAAILFFRLRTIRTGEPSPVFSFPMLKKISRIAVPSILQQSFISVGNLIIQVLINGYGSSVIAGYSAALKLNTFAVTSFTTLGNGLSSFTAQNIGAKKTERVSLGFRAGVKLALIVAALFVLPYFFNASGLIRLFLSDASAGAWKTGTVFLKIVSPFYFLICLKLMADGVLRGAGAMRQFMIATFSDLILRVVLAYVFSALFGSTGIWISWPVGWIAGMLLSWLFYHSGCWQGQPAH